MKYLPPLFITLALVAVGTPSYAGIPYDSYSYRPPQGYVQTREMAIAIAEIVLDSIYGKKVIDQERPLVAVLDKDVWEVRGTLPKDYEGGTAMIRISKKTGEILRVVHYK